MDLIGPTGLVNLTLIIGLLAAVWGLLMLIYIARTSYYLKNCLRELRILNALIKELEGDSGKDVKEIEGS